MDDFANLADLLHQTATPRPEPTERMAATLPSIKIEEHVAPSSTITPDLLSLDSPEPTASSSRQPKKRKSWGQVLPEPKTSLPPRKRAKTADEKEQRRIERVKRNRLAAHNSRERKREEMEKLSVINDGLVSQINAMKEQMTAMAAEISALRSGSSSASVPATTNTFDLTTRHEPFEFTCQDVPQQQQAPPSMVSPPMTATTSLQTPELGNLDSPDLDEPLDDFPATPMEDAFGGEDSYVPLMPQLFQPALVAKPQPAAAPSRLDGHLHPQPPALPVDCLDHFLNFDGLETAGKPASDPSFPASELIDLTSPASLDDLLDDGASASSDFLDFIAADQGAPAKGSDGSGCAVEEGASYAQLFAETIAL